MTYEELLRDGQQKARKHRLEEEAVKFLLIELSAMEPHLFYLSLKNSVPKTIQEQFVKVLDRYLFHHEPVQYLLGYTYFYNRRFFVNEDVLIPRRETEQLVDILLKEIKLFWPNEKPLSVLDLGTGSGCIGITLSLENPSLEVTLVDLSHKALVVAKRNSQKFNASVHLVQSDWFEKIHETYDVIVANPPYIRDEEPLDNIVDKEPKSALYGGIYGLDSYEAILKSVHQHIQKKSIIFFEHGAEQKQALNELIYQFLPNAQITHLKDYQNKDRFTMIKIGVDLHDV
ncbi:MAG: peptide chain release factor N(5)-glutamine methyltransferase [Acholeplasmataceae bacterium]|nr:peptide chain release factor N(5)-glutamine methyltransferase [Acholeplasmataceae bacterium]